MKNHYFVRKRLLPFSIIAIFVFSCSIILCAGEYDLRKTILVIVCGMLAIAGMLYFNNYWQRKFLSKQRGARRMYHRLVDILPDAIVIEKNNKIVFVNDSGIELLGGWRLSDIKGKSVFDFIPEEYHQDVSDKIEFMQSHFDAVKMLANHIITLQGRSIDVEISAIPIIEEHNLIIQYFIKDITDRVVAQERTLETQIQSQYLSQFSNVCLWKSDIDGNLCFINETWSLLTGRPRFQFDSTGIDNWSDLIHPDDREQTFAIFREALKTHQQFVIEHRLLDHNQNYLWMLVKGIPNYNSDNEYVGFIGHCLDITERKQMELEVVRAKEKAVESDKLKSSFLANLSHEIRTPMNAIIGFSCFLDDMDLSPAKRSEYIGIIRSSSYKLLSVISDTIEIARIDTEQMQVYDDKFNLRSLVRGIIEEAQGYISKTKCIEIHLEMDPSISMDVISDKTKLRTIIMNIMSNAVKYTESGQVRLVCKCEADALLVRIEDTGIGIPKSDLDLVFKRFYRVENVNTIKEGGIGLGLSIAGEYVNMLGGKINIDSVLGRGTTVDIQIPIKFADTNNVNIKKSLKKSKILIVEDDDYNYMYVSDILEQKGLLVDRANNGQLAIDMLGRKQSYSLVLMDLKMPEMDGYEAIDIIRGSNNQIPVIAQTAYMLGEEQEKIAKHGFNGFVSKPINVTSLLDVVKNYVAIE